jgi:acyl carrier protein
MNLPESVSSLIAMSFGISKDRISSSTRQADIPEWDSVGHLNLMLALEDTFGIRLDVDDMKRLTTVEAILNYLEEAGCRLN